ncbi:MAG: AAA family ATPase [Thaumarchaeota archaeon]|nr:AAA family ATPase [Nitrososphaerota archaeon]
MKSRAKPVQMRVIEAKQRDVGKKRARISHAVMNSLGITPGDIVELIGKNRTAATVWPVDEDDIDDDVIRIDGQTRKNARVSLNDLVQVKKNNTKSARSITLLPMGDKIVVDREFCEFVKNRLKGLPLAEGDEISVVILGNPMYFKVQKVVPKIIVDINHSTKLNILADSTISKKPRVTYEEIGGLKEKIEKLHEIIELPLRHPEVFQRLGIEPHKGIMLYGPPGCGKTLIAKALASESEANFFSINGPEIMNKYYGETEARLREIFKESRENAPSIVFIDEIDAIAPKREEAFGDVEKRVVAQLLALMDGLSERGNVIVIGATNRPESVDPALRRPGRFDRELEVGVPNVEGRIEVLQIHTRGMPLADDINLKKLANELHGYTGADIKALCREAAMKAMKHYLPEIDFESDKISPEVLENMIISNKNFYDGMKEIIPTALREFYVETPKVRWESVGGLYEVKRRLYDNLITAIKEPETFQNLGISPPKGALLYGPPGCGKTLIAWALATESGANIIMVKGPEVLSKWVGESEKAIRDIFRKARASSPCIVVFDELDSIARPRSSISEDSGVSERVLSQVLTDMEDIGHTGVIVVGITNRPDLIDTSLLRPGRLDVITYIPAPDEQSRLEILKIITRNIPLTKDVSMEELAKTTKSHSGADLVGVCREAVINAMRNKRSEIYSSDFDKALRRVKPSITTDVEIWYDSVSKNVTYALPKPVDKAFYG